MDSVGTKCKTGHLLPGSQSSSSSWAFVFSVCICSRPKSPKTPILRELRFSAIIITTWDCLVLSRYWARSAILLGILPVELAHLSLPKLSKFLFHLEVVSP